MTPRAVYAVDPGPVHSALVVYDGAVRAHATLPNDDLLSRLATHLGTPQHVLAIEQIASYGMPVGAEVFETCVWSGRFIQAWTGYHDPPRPWMPVKRLAVKLALCHDSRARDASIRQALLDRFGPGRHAALGTKKAPGPLYGVTGDEWAALAVAVTVWDRVRQTSTSEAGALEA